MVGGTMWRMNIGSRDAEVLDIMSVRGYGTVPLMNIRMMDERRERELAAQSAARWKEVGL